MSATFAFDDPLVATPATAKNPPLDKTQNGRLYGQLGVVSGKITGDASYPTGGYAVAPLPKFGLKAVTGVLAQSDGVHTLVYNSGTDKVQLFASGAEVANATNVSTVVLYFEARGTML